MVTPQVPDKPLALRLWLPDRKLGEKGQKGQYVVA